MAPRAAGATDRRGGPRRVLSHSRAGPPRNDLRPVPRSCAIRQAAECRLPIAQPEMAATAERRSWCRWISVTSPLDRCTTEGSSPPSPGLGHSTWSRTATPFGPFRHVTSNRTEIRDGSERFRLCLRHCRITEGTGCWLWDGALANNMTPVFRVSGETVTVRRWLYGQLVGPPEGNVHSCVLDWRCVNPAHAKATRAA